MTDIVEIKNNDNIISDNAVDFIFLFNIKLSEYVLTMYSQRCYLTIKLDKSKDSLPKRGSIDIQLLRDFIRLHDETN